MLRVPSPLPEDLEALVHKTIGCCIAVELKSVEQLVAVNHAQLLSYMRVSQKRVGLLINFNVVVLKDGLTRKVL